MLVVQHQYCHVASLTLKVLLPLHVAISFSSIIASPFSRVSLAIAEPRCNPTTLSHKAMPGLFGGGTIILVYKSSLHVVERIRLGVPKVGLAKSWNFLFKKVLMNSFQKFKNTKIQKAALFSLFMGFHWRTVCLIPWKNGWEVDKTVQKMRENKIRLWYPSP